MISSNKIKQAAKKEGKKISKTAVVKIIKYIEMEIKDKIKEAKKNADNFGRKIIKEEDILYLNMEIGEENGC
jgi:histone H3/H4